MAHIESWKCFGRRVQRLTGFSFESIPIGEIADLRGRKVICQRGKTCVVRVADPTIERENDPDGDGSHTFEPFDEADHFRVVKLDD